MSTRGCGRNGNSGRTHAGEIADILAKYTKYNGRRKPELLSPTTYSLVNYQEAETVVADFKAITRKAEAIFDKLPADAKDAFYELVLFPTKASALVNELYLAAGKNALYAKQGRSATNEMAEETRSAFRGGHCSHGALQPRPGRRQVGPFHGPDASGIHQLGGSAGEQPEGNSAHRN